jgi:hypothetical protein
MELVDAMLGLMVEAQTCGPAWAQGFCGSRRPGLDRLFGRCIRERTNP